MNRSERIHRAKREGTLDGWHAARRGEIPMMAGRSKLPCFFPDDGAGDAELREYDESFFDAWLGVNTGKTIQQIWQERDAR